MKATLLLLCVFFSFIVIGLVNSQQQQQNIEFLNSIPLFNTVLNTSLIETYSIKGIHSLHAGPNNEIWFHSQNKLTQYSQGQIDQIISASGPLAADTGVAVSNITLTSTNIVHVNKVTKDIYLYIGCKIFQVVDGILQKIAGSIDSSCGAQASDRLANSTRINRENIMHATEDYIYLYQSDIISKINLKTNIMSSVLGDTFWGNPSNNTLASKSRISSCTALTHYNSELYFADNVVFKITANDMMYMVVGNPKSCTVDLSVTDRFTACFKSIIGLQMYKDELYILMKDNVRKLNKNGQVERVVGNLGSAFFLKGLAINTGMQATSFLIVNDKLYLGEDRILRVVDLVSGEISGLIGSLENYNVQQYGIPYGSTTKIYKGIKDEYYLVDEYSVRRHEMSTNKFSCIVYFAETTASAPFDIDRLTGDVYFYRSQRFYWYQPSTDNLTVIASGTYITSEYPQFYVFNNLQSIKIYQDVLYLVQYSLIATYHLRDRVFKRYLGNAINSINFVSGYGGNATLGNFPTKELVIEKYKNETYLSDTYGYISKINTEGILELLIGNPLSISSSRWVDNLSENPKLALLNMASYSAGDSKDVRYFGHNPNGELWFKDGLNGFKLTTNNTISKIPTSASSFTNVYISCDQGDGSMYFTINDYTLEKNAVKLYSSSGVAGTEITNACAINNAYVVAIVKDKILKIAKVGSSVTTISQLTDATKYTQSASSTYFLYGTCDYGNQYFYYSTVVDGVFRYSITSGTITKVMSYTRSYPFNFYGNTTQTTFSSNWVSPIGNELYFTHKGGIVSFNMVDSTSKMLYGGFKGNGMRREHLFTLISSYSFTSNGDLCFFDGYTLFGKISNDIFNILIYNETITSTIRDKAGRAISIGSNCYYRIGNTVYDTSGIKQFSLPDNAIIMNNVGDTLFTNGTSLSLLPVNCIRDEYFDCRANQNITCYGIEFSSDQVCSGKGVCVNVDTCQCYNDSAIGDCSTFRNSTILDNSTIIVNQTNLNETSLNGNNMTNMDNTTNLSNYTTINETNISNSTIVNNETLTNTTEILNNTNSSINITINNGTDPINNNSSSSINNTINNNSINITTNNGTDLISNNTMYNVTNYNNTLNSSISNSTYINNQTDNSNITLVNNTLIIGNLTLNNVTNSISNSTCLNSSIACSNSSLLNSTTSSQALNSTNSTIITCYGIKANDSLVCNSKGNCKQKDVCECYSNSSLGYFASPKCSNCQQNYYGKSCLSKFGNVLRLSDDADGLEMLITSPYWYHQSTVECSDLIHSTDLKLFGNIPKCYWKDTRVPGW